MSVLNRIRDVLTTDRLRALQRLVLGLSRWLPLIVALVGLSVVVELGLVLSTRLSFPADLEWLEGGQLLHAYRVLHGQELFTKPNEGFMPYSYPPGHTLALAIFGVFFGVDYGVGRMVSCLAFGVVSSILISQCFKAFSRPEMRWTAAVLGSGLIAAAFPITGGWFDLVRNDELALSLSLSAGMLALSAATMSRRRFITTVLVMNAAVFTKQTAVFYLIWILLFHLVRNPKQALRLGLALAIVGALTTGLLEWMTHSRYLYYTISLLSKQVIHQHMYEDAIQRWLTFAPYLPGVPVLALILGLCRLLHQRAVFWLGILAAAFPASILPYAKQGGYINNLLPVAVLAGPVVLIVLGSLSTSWAKRAKRTHGAAFLGLTALTVVYLNSRRFDRAIYSVTPERRAAAERLLATLRSLGPSVWSPHHPFLAMQAGSTVEQVHEMPWVDAWFAGVQGLTLKPYVDRTRPKYVILTGLEVPLVTDALARDYYLERILPEADLVPPITGLRTFPKFILARADKPPSQCLFQFEGGVADWKQSGEAFLFPLRSADASGRDIVGRRGAFLITSLGRGSDAATGTISSPPFQITHSTISSLVGGGASAAVALRLVVGSSVVREARGGTREILERVVWDVQQFFGKEAHIELDDQDPGAHILADQICFEAPK